MQFCVKMHKDAWSALIIICSHEAARAQSQLGTGDPAIGLQTSTQEMENLRRKAKAGFLKRLLRLMHP